jgi:hypothetical protein
VHSYFDDVNDVAVAHVSHSHLSQSENVIRGDTVRSPQYFIRQVPECGCFWTAGVLLDGVLEREEHSRHRTSRATVASYKRQAV